MWLQYTRKAVNGYHLSDDSMYMPKLTAGVV